jgi:hypothetical protein
MTIVPCVYFVSTQAFIASTQYEYHHTAAHSTIYANGPPVERECPPYGGHTSPLIVIDGVTDVSTASR